MSTPPPRGLPPRIYVPILAVVAVLFLGVMGYFLRIGFGETGTALGGTVPAGTVPEQGDARIAATPVPEATDAPGTVDVPQTGTGPMNGGVQNAAPATPDAAGGAAALPAQKAGGPPAPVMAMLKALDGRLAQNPNDLEALVSLADLYFDAGMYERSIAYFKRAIAIDPNNPDTRTDYAAALHATGHDLAALQQIDTVLAQHKNFPQALFDRGVVAASIGRRTEAVTAFQTFLRIAPNDKHAADARTALANLGSS